MTFPMIKLSKRIFSLTVMLLVTMLLLTGCQSQPKQAPAQPAVDPVMNPPSSTAATGNASTDAASPTTKDARPIIVAFGDSLTAGYGLPEDQSYTTLLQEKIDAGGYAYRVVNAGVSGDTSAGGVRRIEWALEGDVKYLILELGGNDALRGLPVNELRKNLSQIIETAQKRQVKVILAGMEAPPNLGAAYTNGFRQVFRELAQQYKLPLIPFVLEGIGGQPELNQADGIHPNAEGEKRMTENIWRVLQPLLVK
jgi:acyl-CoA thioesterase I